MKYYSEAEARELVIKAGHMLLEQKLIARTWGNISARISEEEFIITPSGRGYETLRPEDLVTVRVRNCSYDGNVKPSSEKGIHAASYALRKEIKFIIHTHQFYASAIAAECRDTRFAPCADYGMPGSARLKKNVETKVRQHPDKRTFLLARHGTLILGRSLEEAFDLASGMEDKCRETFMSRVSDEDNTPRSRINAEAIRTEVFPCVTVIRDPYIMACCNAGETVGSYIDDFAQIVGPDMQVVDNDVTIVQRTLLGYSNNGGRKPEKKNTFINLPLTGALHQRGGMHPMLNPLIGRNAVLVRGVGAVCAGRTKGDLEAIAMIVSKNCAAACYVREASPLGWADARRQRYNYLTSYSKRINSR